MTNFAETPVSFPDGQQNVAQPPSAILANGFIPATALNRGQPLPAQWLNWLFQKVFRHLNRDKVSDTNGVGLFTTPNSFIEFHAIDRNDVTRHISAIGYKAGAGDVHVLHVLASNTLTLGTPTAGGDQPVAGGTDVICRAVSRQFGEL